MKLYEINHALEEAWERAMDPETGEILDADAIEEINNLEMAKEEKIENVALWIKDIEAEQSAIREEKRRFDARMATNSRKIESLKKYLQYATDGQKFKTTRCSVSYRRSEEVVVTPGYEQYLPDELRRVKYEPDKVKIKRAIKDGQKLDGCMICEKQSMIIR